MNQTVIRLQKILAIALAIIQIPMLMLWKITYNAVKLDSHGVDVIDGSYTLTFQWELFGGAVLRYLHVILALAVCLAASVVGLILVLKRKERSGITTACLYAAMVVAGEILLYAFSHPYLQAGQVNNALVLNEYMSYRYFMGMELNIDPVYPFLKAVKYVFIILSMILSGGLCGLGIARAVVRRKASSEGGDPLLTSDASV
ncbi:MAG: hypothetical protein IJW00_09175 [Clostridia bacterium]|nr:hypothetical protein [Clostridia bacterium]